MYSAGMSQTSNMLATNTLPPAGRRKKGFKGVAQAKSQHVQSKRKSNASRPGPETRAPDAPALANDASPFSALSIQRGRRQETRRIHAAADPNRRHPRLSETHGGLSGVRNSNKYALPRTDESTHEPWHLDNSRRVDG